MSLQRQADCACPLCSAALRVDGVGAHLLQEHVGHRLPLWRCGGDCLFKSESFEDMCSHSLVTGHPAKRISLEGVEDLVTLLTRVQSLLNRPTINSQSETITLDQEHPRTEHQSSTRAVSRASSFAWKQEERRRIESSSPTVPLDDPNELEELKLDTAHSSDSDLVSRPDDFSQSEEEMDGTASVSSMMSETGSSGSVARVSVRRRRCERCKEGLVFTGAVAAVDHILSGRHGWAKRPPWHCTRCKGFVTRSIREFRTHILKAHQLQGRGGMRGAVRLEVERMKLMEELELAFPPLNRIHHKAQLWLEEITSSSITSPF